MPLTNFDPNAHSLGGIKVSSGRKVSEINNTISDKITSNFSRNITKRNKRFYFSGDPADKSEKAFFTFYPTRFGIGLIVGDPIATETDEIDAPKNAFGFQNSFYNNSYFKFNSNPTENIRKNLNQKSTKAGNLFLSNLKNVGNDFLSKNEKFEFDHRLWLFTSSNYLIWKSWSIQEQRTSGAGQIWIRSSPKDNHFTRNEVPAVAARSFKNWPQDKAMAPAHETSGRSIQLKVDEEMRMVPNRGDSQGREIIQSQIAYTPNKPIPAFWGEVPGVKVIRSSAVAVWNTMKLNGNNYVCFHKEKDRGYLTRYENGK